jgi:hypothetical protein
MPDLETTTREDAHWEKFGTFPPGTRIVIVVNPTQAPGGTVLFDRTVPAGKTAKARISIDAELGPAG